MFKFYIVGGSVRDEIMGLTSKDIDYVAVSDDHIIQQNLKVEEVFNMLITYLKTSGFEIFLITENCLTIRARFPKDHKFSGVADFVLARKEIGYIPNTRTPIVVPGTLMDDLLRRDYCFNTLIKDDEGNIIDHLGGMDDIKNKILRTPLDPYTTMMDDPLRLLRGIRFSITKNMKITDFIDVLNNPNFIEKFKLTVSKERIREELIKMFEYDTIGSMNILTELTIKYPSLNPMLFENISLVPKIKN